MDCFASFAMTVSIGSSGRLKSNLSFTSARLRGEIDAQPRSEGIIRERARAGALRIARGQRFAGEHAAAERRSEQPEIRSGAGQGIVWGRGETLQQPSAG